MSAIPSFPAFRPVDQELQLEITSFANRFPSYSDFNFVSLYSWNTENDMSVSWLNDNLVLECRDYTSSDTFYSFMGSGAIEETARTLLQQASQKGHCPELRLVPEMSVQSLVAHPEFEIVEDPDNYDYLLSVADLVSLAGSRNKHTRELVNRFLRDYGETASFHECDINDSLLVERLQTLFQIREAATGVDREDSQKELAAFERSLKSQNHAALRIFGISVEGQLQALIVYEQISETVGLAHFCKANTAIRGIYQYMWHALGKVLHDEGTKIINIEQDLGLPGLRASKQHLRPVDQLKKYAVTFSKGENMKAI
jgi:hypothetical protein